MSLGAQCPQFHGLSLVEGLVVLDNIPFLYYNINIVTFQKILYYLSLVLMSFKILYVLLKP